MNKPHTLARIAWGICILIGIVLSFKALREPDLWWMYRTGEWMLENGAVTKTDPFSYTFEGVEWINVKWLFEVIIATGKNWFGVEFIFVFQDVRGRNGSEGEFVHMRPHHPEKGGPQDIDESTDAYDTIDWLVTHVANNNGKVGMMGISYPGFYTAAGMIDSHPALKCASPQAPIADWFIGHDIHHNGAFYLPHAFRFFSRFGQKLEEPTREQAKPFDYKTPDGYAFYLNLGPVANV